MMSANGPFLVSCKPLKPEFENMTKIQITCDNFTIGRNKQSSALIATTFISRNHCILKKDGNDWIIEDSSLCGISVNGTQLGKTKSRKLAHEDVITLEPSEEFVYKFVDPTDDIDVFEIPRKRIKLEPNVDDDLIKTKFEESQTYEMQHLAEKLHNTQQQKTTTKILKDQLQLDMNRKIEDLEKNFAEQIENLKGEKDEVERQKAILIEERDAQLSIVREEMEGKITELMDQIRKHNETETELLNENNQLKEKLMKEREEFMLELNRATSSKDEMLKKLEAKAREQEEIRIKEKQEWEEQLRRETELLKLAKEQEIKELEEKRKQREEELVEELNNMKTNLLAQEAQTAQQRLQAEEQLAQQMEAMKKLSDEDKAKMEELLKEREEIQRKLLEAETNALKSIEEAKAKMKEREKELASIEEVQKLAEQSNEVIVSLQQQLENMRNQLQTVETEKNTLLESLILPDSGGEGTSKQAALAEVSEIVDSELQCSICAEQFIGATTLNCSHTFCRYCITMWKKKKKDCPICRAPITSECKSLVIDSFIEKIISTQSEEAKKRRQEMLKSREELESELAQPTRREDGRGGRSYDNSDSDDIELIEEEEEPEDDDSYGGYTSFGEYDEYDDEYPEFDYYTRRYEFEDSSNADSDGGSDASTESDTPAPGAPPAPAPAPGPGGAAAGAHAASDGTSSSDSVQRTTGLSSSTAERSNRVRGRRATTVPGIPGSYYGGYGRCFVCNHPGHWAPGCPFR